MGGSLLLDCLGVYEVVGSRVLGLELATLRLCGISLMILIPFYFNLDFKKLLVRCKIDKNSLRPVSKKKEIGSFFVY